VIEVIPLRDIPEIEEGEDLASLIVASAGEGGIDQGDVIVVTQKVVSKAEGRMADAADRAEMIAGESKRVLRRTPGGMVIAETRHGFVCANAGIDESNVPEGRIALLPIDPDASARRLRSKIHHATGHEVAVIVSDTFGRAWRIGQTDVAIGVAGMDPFIDYRGTSDKEGRVLKATRICVADEIAGAAEMVMGKAEAVCAAIVRGVTYEPVRGSATDIVRPPREDMFR
jgi:coenzyme F420-0:L-glutamate ligase/coenzyme F420-1:gamma-L-glutamate ligase